MDVAVLGRTDFTGSDFGGLVTFGITVGFWVGRGDGVGVSFGGNLVGRGDCLTRTALT